MHLVGPHIHFLLLLHSVFIIFTMPFYMNGILAAWNKLHYMAYNPYYLLTISNLRLMPSFRLRSLRSFSTRALVLCFLSFVLNFDFSSEWNEIWKFDLFHCSSNFCFIWFLCVLDFICFRHSPVSLIFSIRCDFSSFYCFFLRVRIFRIVTVSLLLFESVHHNSSILNCLSIA